jgi:hypothetical protein
MTDAVEYRLFPASRSPDALAALLLDASSFAASLLTLHGHVWHCEPFALRSAATLGGHLAGRVVFGDNIEVGSAAVAPASCVWLH